MNSKLKEVSKSTRGLLFILLISAFVGLPNLAYGQGENVVYVSSSIGNDFNDGLDADHPIKNIRIALERGNVILLKANDSFYIGNLFISNKTLSRYGDGNNPTICGYKRIVKPEWKKVESNIWLLKLTEDNFSGIVLSGSSLSNNICAIHDYESDLIHGRKVWKKKEMTKNWDFWQTETLAKAKPEEYDNLYLYLTTDPNKLKLELSIYDCALQVTNSLVDGVNFEGFGFGISAGSKTVIRNCKVDAMGGRIIPEGDGYNCYGNGIEFWVSGTRNVEDCIVEDCHVSRCYDCGITIQGSKGTTATPRNIIIRNNLITNCCQGWEDFLRNDPDVVYENCVFGNNIVLHSGNTTGWGYSPLRFKFCHVLGNNVSGDKGMRIENNTFVDGNFYCSGIYNNGYRSNLWKGNKCYLTPGNFVLGEYNGKRDVLRMKTTRRKSSSEIKLYRELTGDASTVFFIQSYEKVTARAVKLEKKFLKSHRY